MNFEKLKAQLIIDEGKKNRLYKDTKGHWTIGIGHNLDANGLSDAAVDFIFNEDIGKFAIDLDKQLPWWRDQPDHVQDVLMNLCFNMGIYGIIMFHKFLTYLQAGDTSAAAGELINSVAYTEEPNRINRLASILRTGVEPNGQPSTT